MYKVKNYASYHLTKRQIQQMSTVKCVSFVLFFIFRQWNYKL